MNPELFLEQNEAKPLLKVLEKFALHTEDPDERRDTLKIAGIDSSFIADLTFNTKPLPFAIQLVTKFIDYPISSQRLDYHPMVSLLQFLADFYDQTLGDEGVTLCKKLVERGQENFKALVVRDAVGMIEAPINTGIGTGVLVDKNLLLTCSHVLSNRDIKQAWIRFGYIAEKPGEAFELDLHTSYSSNQLDYTLITIIGPLKQSPAILSYDRPTSGQKIYLVHHPRGKSLVIDLGRITREGNNSIYHDSSADQGSSGAPIFNSNWQVIAIHRGDSGTRVRATSSRTEGEGIPTYAFQDKISQYTSSGNWKLSNTQHAVDLEQQQQRLLHIRKIEPSEIDENIIIRYDLDTEMGEFRKQLNFGGASTFAITGTPEFLELIIDRMVIEVQDKLNGFHEMEKIYLQRDAKIKQINIKTIISKIHGYQNLIDIFTNNYNKNLILILWNYDMTQEMIRQVAKTLRREIRTKITPFLEKHGKYFVVILADPRSMENYFIDEFTIFSVKEQVDFSELWKWVEGHLRQLDIQENAKDLIIASCKNRLAKENGHLVATHAAMRAIIKELQDGAIIL